MGRNKKEDANTYRKKGISVRVRGVGCMLTVFRERLNVEAHHGSAVQRGDLSDSLNASTISIVL